MIHEQIVAITTCVSCVGLFEAQAIHLAVMDGYPERDIGAAASSDIIRKTTRRHHRPARGQKTSQEKERDHFRKSGSRREPITAQQAFCSGGRAAARNVAQCTTLNEPRLDSERSRARGGGRIV